MITSHGIRRRSGAAVVEVAIVAPVVLFFILAQIVGGLGVSRYQEIAHLARECARYASTHGGMYQKEGIPGKTGVPAVATATDLRNFLAGRTVLLPLSQIQINVSWTAPSSVNTRNIPTYLVVDPTFRTSGFDYRRITKLRQISGRSPSRITPATSGACVEDVSVR